MGSPAAKLGCSLQDGTGDSAGRASFAPLGCTGPIWDVSAGSSSGTRDGGPATSLGCPGTPVGTEGRFAACDGGTRADAGIGSSHHSLGIEILATAGNGRLR